MYSAVIKEFFFVFPSCSQESARWFSPISRSRWHSPHTQKNAQIPGSLCQVKPCMPTQTQLHKRLWVLPWGGSMFRWETFLNTVLVQSSDHQGTPSIINSQLFIFNMSSVRGSPLCNYYLGIQPNGDNLCSEIHSQSWTTSIKNDQSSRTERWLGPGLRWRNHGHAAGRPQTPWPEAAPAELGVPRPARSTLPGWMVTMFPTGAGRSPEAHSSAPRPLPHPTEPSKWLPSNFMESFWSNGRNSPAP